ncbi:unnamed protein product, partial [Rotaria magnacalcarata]
MIDIDHDRNNKIEYSYRYDQDDTLWDRYKYKRADESEGFKL